MVSVPAARALTVESDASVTITDQLYTPLAG
jgi:hypothetical protein